MQGDEFGNLADLGGPTLDVKYSFILFKARLHSLTYIISITNIFYFFVALNFVAEEHHRFVEDGWQDMSSFSTNVAL